MLSCLRVHNLAIIEELEVEFGPGLNIVTGETGAGKSIIVASLQLVLGSRARPEMVRTGCEQAEIQALFELTDPATQARVRHMDLGDGSEILIRRIVKASGRSKVYINGRLCTLTELRELCSELVDISSQHQHTTLVQPSTHLHFLDAFGGHRELRVQVAEAWGGLRQAQLHLRDLEQRFRNRVQHEDLLRLQIEELAAAQPRQGELDELTAELSRLHHAGGLLEAAAEAGDLLDGDDGICRLLGQAGGAIARASAHDPALAELEQRVESARTELQDIAYDLATYSRAINADPARVLQLEERVTTLRRLVRKHGTDEAGLVALHERALVEIIGFADLEMLLHDASERVAGLLDVAAGVARELSERRHERSAGLSSAITAELHELGMGSAQVEVRVASLEGATDELQVDGARLTEVGLDRVEFLIAPNPGEPPRPLSQVASGGELSRSLLAIKRVLAGAGPVGLYVFDEVDSGVGGGIAEVIGHKIRQVAGYHQVLCITHQAQIAAFADEHFFVSKQVEHGRTSCHIRALDPPSRAEELARMMGGVTIDAATRVAAGELLVRTQGDRL